MANQALPISEDLILQAIQLIDLIINDNNSMIENIDRSLLNLSNSWERTLVYNYAEKFDQYKRDVLPRFFALMNGYRYLLQTIAEDIAQTNNNPFVGFNYI